MTAPTTPAKRKETEMNTTLFHQRLRKAVGKPLNCETLAEAVGDGARPENFSVDIRKTDEGEWAQIWFRGNIGARLTLTSERMIAGVV